MPRRHDRARERPGVEAVGDAARTLGAPAWALRPGFDVRAVATDKEYRCPGCEQEIRPAASHLVVVPSDAPDERRHWHTPCGRREIGAR